MSEAQLRENLRNATGLIEQGRHAEAVPALQTVRDSMAALHLPLAYVNWQLAMAADLSGNLRVAMHAIVAAVREDPINPCFQTSRNVIARRVYETLLGCDDDDVPELVQFLEEVGEVPVLARIRQAEWLLRNGRPQAAARLVHACHVIEPCGEAVRDMAQRIAGVLGGEWLTDLDARFGTAGHENHAMVPALPPSSKSN